MKKSADDKKSMKNYPECNELNYSSDKEERREKKHKKKSKKRKHRGVSTIILAFRSQTCNCKKGSDWLKRWEAQHNKVVKCFVIGH